MTMKTSNAGILAIVDHEAVVLSPYKDSVGVLTVGVGHTSSAGAPDPRHVSTLNLEEALRIFTTDLAKFEKRVNDAVTVPIAQHEFDAMVSFDFNTGGIHRATFVETLNAGDRETAIVQIMNWKKPPEIIGRRKKEQALFREGKYPDINKLKVYDRFPGAVKLVPAPERYLSDSPTPTAPEPSSPPPPVMPKEQPPAPSSGGWWAQIKSWFS